MCSCMKAIVEYTNTAVVRDRRQGYRICRNTMLPAVLHSILPTVLHMVHPEAPNKEYPLRSTWYCSMCCTYRARSLFNVGRPPAVDVVPMLSPITDLHLPCDRSNLNAYIVVVGESTTTPWYTTLVDIGDLEVDDPPPVCVAPSTGRFEVKMSQ